MTLIQDLQRIARKGPPGPPPRPNWVWHEETSRWRNPKNWEESEEHQAKPINVPDDKYRIWDERDEEKAYNILLNESEEWRQSLSSQEYKALSLYADNPVVNEFLRDNEQGREEQVRNMDSALAKSKVLKNTVVFRGISGSMDFDPKDIVGKTFKDPGYASTTFQSMVALDFATMNGIILAINLPAGSKGGFLGSIVEGGDPVGEIVLPRGTKLKVAKKPSSYKKTHKGIKIPIYQAEVV